MRLNGPKLLSLLLATFTLVGCGAEDPLDRESSAGGESAFTFDLEKSLRDAQRAADRYLGQEGREARAAWDKEPGGKAWSEFTLKAIQDNKVVFNTPKDIEDFCPGYPSATSYERETCWLRIISALAFFESGFDPKETYLEHTGTTSVGLLMMNPAHCGSAPSVEALQEPEANLRCALDRMILLLQRDKVVSASNPYRGGAAYWSPLRELYRFRNLMLGRKPHIQLFTKSYRNAPYAAGDETATP